MAKKSPKATALNIELVPIDSVRPDPENARLHPDRNLEAIKESLTTFGQQQPIIVDRRGVVVVGNARLAAAKALGWTEIQVVRTKLTGKQRTAFAIADNRTGELAEWDESILADALRLLNDDGMLESVGFTAEEMAKFTDVEPDSSSNGARVVEGKAAEPSSTVDLLLSFNAAQWSEFQAARDRYAERTGVSDLTAIVHGFAQHYMHCEEVAAPL